MNTQTILKIWGFSSVAECLPSTYKALSSIPRGRRWGERKREIRKKRGGRERKKRDLLTQRSEVDFRCLNCISPFLVCSLTVSDRYKTYLISHLRPVLSHFQPVLPPLCTPFDPFFLPNYSPSYFFLSCLFVTHWVLFLLKNKKNSDY